MEELLHYQDKRLNRQQLIFAGFFLAVVAALAYYVGVRTVYATYDGYINLDENHVRAMDDICVMKIYKDVGDTVQAGDTLFSYILLENILDQYNLNAMPTVVKQTNDLKLQSKLAQQEIPVLRTRLKELRRQLDDERNDIYYGLTDNTKRNALEAQIAEVEEQLRKQVAKVGAYDDMERSTQTYLRERGAASERARMPYAPGHQTYDEAMVHYCCAPSWGVVIDVAVPDRTVAFKSETVMKTQPWDYMSCHLGVVAYIPNDKVKYLRSKESVEVIVNKDITLKAQLTMVGIRVETIPNHLRSNFSRDADAVLAYFHFLPYQKVPRWVTTANLPVRIRVNKLKAIKEPMELPEYTIPDEDGNTEPTKKPKQ